MLCCLELGEGGATTSWCNTKAGHCGLSPGFLGFHEGDLVDELVFKVGSLLVCVCWNVLVGYHLTLPAHPSPFLGRIEMSIVYFTRQLSISCNRIYVWHLAWSLLERSYCLLGGSLGLCSLCTSNDANVIHQGDAGFCAWQTVAKSDVCWYIYHLPR